MQRVKRSTAVALLPAAPAGGTPGYFAQPNPQGGVPATQPGFEWYNGVQEELMAVIEGQGLSGSDTDHTKLRQAITKMIQSGQRAVIINNATFAGAVTGTGKAVYWDSANSRFDLALADGSAKQNIVGFADVANANVYAFGDAVLFAGLTAGNRYYLDGATAGSITVTAPANPVFVGIAKGATELFVDVDAAGGISSYQVQNQTFTAFTTGGAVPNFTLTPTPAIGAYAVNQRFRVNFNAPGITGSNTLNISGLGAKNIKQYDQLGNKVSGVIAAVGQLADVEYDGQDMVILDPLPLAAGSPSPARQTTLGGPVDANGLPSFLPATSASLSLTSQNISGTAPLVVSSANGFSTAGAVDRIGLCSANLTWAGLTPSAVNYLYVDVAANGTLTPGATTLAPVYQQGGTRSTVNNQHTYNIAEAYMSVGNGAAASQVNRVFVGEAVAGVSTITSTVAYGYGGQYLGAWTNTLPSAAALLVINHNLGTDLVDTNWEIENITPEFNYTAGMRVKNPSQGSTYWMQAQWRQARNTTTCRGGSSAFCLVVDATSGVMSTPTVANWKYRVFVKRNW